MVAKKADYALQQNVPFYTMDPLDHIEAETKWMTLIKTTVFWLKFSLEFVPNGPINNKPALVQIMVWHQTGDKPLSEPMMA